MAVEPGQKFGTLVVQERAQPRDRIRFWQLACSACGAISEVAQTALSGGREPECEACSDPFAVDSDVPAETVSLPLSAQITAAVLAGNAAAKARYTFKHEVNALEGVGIDPFAVEIEECDPHDFEDPWTTQPSGLEAVLARVADALTEIADAIRKLAP